MKYVPIPVAMLPVGTPNGSRAMVRTMRKRLRKMNIAERRRRTLSTAS